jgi:hypothetical protein
MDWRMKDAETRIGEIIDKALSEGPQTILLEGEAVVVVKAEDYSRLVPRPSFKAYLLNGPSLEGLDLERDKSLPRDVDFGTRRIVAGRFWSIPASSRSSTGRRPT